MESPNIFDTEEQGNTIIVIPLRDLADFEESAVNTAIGGLMESLSDPAIRSAVIDLETTPYISSRLLGALIGLWKKIKERGGGLAFCNVSASEAHVLALTHLDKEWPICGSREDAVRAVSGAS